MTSSPSPTTTPFPPGRGGPRLPRTYVPRTSFWTQLDEATRGPVTLVVAPAGAGKTLGVGGWLDRRGAPARWITADVSWDSGRLRGLLTPGSPGLLVIDDAHLLPPSAVGLLDERLSQAPESLRVLLLSRWDLRLRRLVPELLGHLTVLRGDVLRLDETESAAMVAAHARTQDPEVVATIGAHAQGWCAAVVLMSRAVATTPDPVAAARRYAGIDARVADRVASEVFAALRPPERHLLLCVAPEGEVSVSTARHLSHDPRAGEILDDLETTGLLVTRVGSDDGSDRRRPGWSDEHDPRYRIHPLLAEVIRRRMAAGGVDVAQARSTVVRAVGLDIERGETTRAFDRLVAVHEHGRAADLLAAEGVTMVMRGQGDAVARFVRAHPDVVADHPGTWFPIAVERWVGSDVESARHWMDRVLRAETPGPGAARNVCGRVACLRLMRARLGLEPLGPAVEHAREVVRASQRDGLNDDVMPQLLTELGITQNWTGDLVRAQADLSTAIGLCRSRELPVLAISAATHLAMTEYMAGRERSGRQVATEAVGMLGDALPWRPRFACDRAGLVLLLTELVDVPWTQEPIDVPDTPPPAHTADLCTRFWMRVRDARLALRAGSVSRAEQILETPLDLPVGIDQLPEHLRVVTLVERAFLAALATDGDTIRACEQDLVALAATGEAALAAGLRADLDGDLRRAASLFATAASGVGRSQPPVRELALVCEAQTLDALGDRDLALRRLQEAASATDVRRNAVPFLGWTRHGTPVAPLLRQLAEQPISPWVRELADAAGSRTDAVAVYATSTATPQERERIIGDRVLPVLSPRERDVLHELARGSTYADIAVNLFVSENTVKTHVSSLYSKLAANRRSEALAVARSLHLL